MVNSVNLGWKNLISNVPRLSQKDRFYKGKREAPEFDLLVHREQEDIVWMKEIVQKIMKPEDLNVDACGGTFFVAKAYMLLDKHRKSVGCEVDPSYVTKAMMQLILLYARQLLSKGLDIYGEEEARLFADVYVKTEKVVEMGRYLNG